MIKNNGIFISFDGMEGTGKTTSINYIKNKIEEKVKNRECLITKEPGSKLDIVCQRLRKLVLDPENDVDNEAEIYLYMSDRCQHVNKVIKPALNRGEIVITDRYIDSTYAYQGYGRRNGSKESLEYMNYLNYKTTGGLLPDITIILTVNPEVGLKRISKRKSEFQKHSLDRIEQEKIDFHYRLMKGFHDVYNQRKDRNIVLIDTTDLTVESQNKKIESIVFDFLESEGTICTKNISI